MHSNIEFRWDDGMSQETLNRVLIVVVLSVKFSSRAPAIIEPDLLLMLFGAPQLATPYKIVRRTDSKFNSSKQKVNLLQIENDKKNWEEAYSVRNDFKRNIEK